jgi:hypothetical protein
VPCSCPGRFSSRGRTDDCISQAPEIYLLYHGSHRKPVSFHFMRVILIFEPALRPEHFHVVAEDICVAVSHPRVDADNSLWCRISKVSRFRRGTGDMGHYVHLRERNGAQS